LAARRALAAARRVRAARPQLEAYSPRAGAKQREAPLRLVAREARPLRSQLGAVPTAAAAQTWQLEDRISLRRRAVPWVLAARPPRVGKRRLLAGSLRRAARQRTVVVRRVRRVNRPLQHRVRVPGFQVRRRPEPAVAASRGHARTLRPWQPSDFSGCSGCAGPAAVVKRQGSCADTTERDSRIQM